MALRPEEILRIKWELGVSVTLIGAEPFITFLAVFDKAIQPFIVDPTTTSTTAVSASAIGQVVPITVTTIPNTATLPPVPAFSVGTNVVVDIGAAQEIVPITAISGTTIYLGLFQAHGANAQPYPVTMAGGEAVVREILNRLVNIAGLLGSNAPLSAGVEQLDKGEVRLFPASTTGSKRGSRDMFGALVQQREQARDDLGEAVGFPNLRRATRGSARRIEVY